MDDGQTAGTDPRSGTPVPPTPPPGPPQVAAPPAYVYEPASYERPRPQRGSTAGFWVLLLLLLGAVAAVGTVAYLREREDDGTAIEADAPSADAAPVSASPTVAVPAPTVPATPAPMTAWMIGAPIPAGRPVAVDPQERIFEFLIRRYDTAAKDSPSIEHWWFYDVAADVSRILTNSTGVPKGTFIEFGPTYRIISYPDGALERIPRTAASTSPEPDVWLARRLAEDDLVPEVAREFTTVVSVSDQEVDGEPITVIGAQLDVVAFAAAHPDVHAEWLWRWASQSPFDPTLIDPAGRQLASDPIPRNDDPAPPLSSEGIDIEMQVDRVGLVFGLTADGSMTTALVIDPIDGFRAWYVLLDAYDDELNVSGFDSQGWIDAPA